MNKITNSFYEIKTYLKSSESALVRKYFTLLGYKYTSSIYNNNFFHFATEALLISLSKAIRLDEITKDTREISIEILKSEINEEDFHSNLEILHGNLENKEADTKFNNSKLASIFLGNFNFSRNSFAQKIKVGTKTFEVTALEQILRKAVNQTINELTGDEELFLSQTFEDLEKVNRDFTLEEYIEKYSSKVNKERTLKEGQLSLNNPCEVFYFYAKADFHSLISDITTFNQQSSSIISLVLGYIKSQYFIKSDRLKSLYQYSRNKYNSLSKNFNQSAIIARENSKKRLDELNVWVLNSYNTCNNTLKEKFPTIHSKVTYIHGNYLSPMSALIYNKVSISFDKTYSFILFSYNKTQENYLKLRELIETSISETYKVTREKATKYVKISKDNLQGIYAVKISFDKLGLSKEKLNELLNRINTYIADFNLEDAKTQARELLVQGKSKILSSYYKFLGCNNEKKEDKVVSESNESNNNKQDVKNNVESKEIKETEQDEDCDEESEN